MHFCTCMFNVFYATYRWAQMLVSNNCTVISLDHMVDHQLADLAVTCSAETGYKLHACMEIWGQGRCMD